MINFEEKKAVLKSFGLSDAKIEEQMLAQFPEYAKIKVLKELGLSDSDIIEKMKPVEPSPASHIQSDLENKYGPDKAFLKFIEALEKEHCIYKEDLYDSIIESFLTYSPRFSEGEDDSDHQITIDGKTYTFNQDRF